MTIPPTTPEDKARSQLVLTHSAKATIIVRELEAALKPHGYHVQDADIRWGDSGPMLVLHVGPQRKAPRAAVWRRFKAQLRQLEDQQRRERDDLIARAEAAEEFTWEEGGE